MLPRRLSPLLAALPLALALVVPALSAPVTASAASCAGTSPAPAWCPVISFGSIVADGVNQPYSSPAVGDLFGDGQKEIVTGGLDGVVRAFNSGGQLLWANQTGGGIQSSPTLANLRGDGRLEVIVTSRNGFINVYNPDGTAFGGHWPMNPTSIGNWGATTHFGSGFMSSAAVGSLNGDGLQDVVVSSLDHRIYAFDAVGNLLPGWPINLWDTVVDTPLLVDLEGRGQRDIVIGSDSNGGVEPNPPGGVWWAFRPDGSLIWKRLQDEVPWSSPSAAILNPGDIQPSIVAGTGHYFNQTASASRGNYVNVYNANGSDRFGHPLGTPKPNYASPALGDILNRKDGSREIVQLSEDTGISAWDGNGTLLWHAANVNGDQLGSPTIAPLGGGACGGGNGVWVPGSHVVGYCAGAQSPAVNFTTPGPSYGAPVVADLGNGHLSLLAIYEDAAVPDGNFAAQNSVLGVWNLSQTSTIPAGAWPAFHGSMQRTGMPAIVPDPRNATFVKNLYHDVLHRTSAPSPSEVAYWQGRLDNGAYRSWVAMALVGSSEAHGFTVDDDYQVMLGRAPDPSGRAFWVGQLDAGVYNEHLLGLLGGSDEYFRVRGNNDFTTLVTSLYRDVLGRTSNPVAPAQDIYYWVGRLQTGMSHAVIGDVFANSHEYHLKVVATWYEHYLFRNPAGDPGWTFWANFLDAGHRDDVGIVQLVASDEYFNHPSFFP
jgi:hypothetical protein